jgi:hypothetical protein
LRGERLDQRQAKRVFQAMAEDRLVATDSLG